MRSRCSCFRRMFWLAPLLALAAAGQSQPENRVGLPEDWSHRHVVFGSVPSRPMPEAAKAEPRFWQQQVRRNLARAAKDKEKFRGRRRRVDWSVNLGGTGSRLAAGTFPAKYTFDINASPNCTNDFVVFALNIAGSGSQATIVAYNNLYSGPGPGPGGLCSLAAPTVKWAYNTGQAINTSPILSLDGKKVAWVSNANPPVLHVLTIGTTGSNGTAVSAPATPGAGNNAVEVEVSYGSVGNTRSSIFVDYSNDVAYVASDSGNIHKFTGIFLGAPTHVTTGGWPILNLDGANRVLTSVVYDSVSGNLFYGTDTGKLGYIREVGSTKGACEAAGTPPCRGLSSKTIGGGANPAIVDAPVVDSATQNVLVLVGNDGAGFARALQADTQLSGPADRQATLGLAGLPLFTGAFDADYFTSAPSGFLYVCGYTTAGAVNPVLYRLGFNGSAKMNLNVDGTSVTLSNAGAAARCSPLTEIFNPTALPLRDWLFVSVTDGCIATGGGGCVMSFDVAPAAMPGAAFSARAAASGTSGIVVDNVSLSSQASSIYFSTQADGTCASDSISTGGCAVKLTQAGLN